MINNRQNGRRRGRGGPQVRNGSGNNPERGNRIDNRARGNAAQLHEKYRNLARDMQTQGDRVMTEYYLQFADHYFRVLSEGRARFEEQNPHQAQQRRPFPQNDDFDDAGYEGDGQGDDEGDGQQRDPHGYDREPRRAAAYEDGQSPNREARDPRDRQRDTGQRDTGQRENGQRENGQRENGQRDNSQRDRGSRDVRDQQGNGRDGGNRPYDANREDQRPPRPPREPYPHPAAPVEAAEPMASLPFVEGVEGEPVRPRRGRPPRRVETAVETGEPQAPRIEVDRLPPAFAAAEPVTAQAEPASPRGRRRTLSKPDTGDVHAAEGEPVAEAAPRRRRVRRDEPDDSTVAA